MNHCPIRPFQLYRHHPKMMNDNFAPNKHAIYKNKKGEWTTGQDVAFFSIIKLILGLTNSFGIWTKFSGFLWPVWKVDFLTRIEQSRGSAFYYWKFHYFRFNPLFEEEVVTNLDISDSMSDEPETISSGGASCSSGYGSNPTTMGRLHIFRCTLLWKKLMLKCSWQFLQCINYNLHIIYQFEGFFNQVFPVPNKFA